MSHRICSISDCGEKHKARGWCATHYHRWFVTGDPESPDARYKHRVCDVEDCSEKHYGHGYCWKHYCRWKNNGDPAVTRPTSVERDGPVGYKAVHLRLRVRKGPASDHSCADCGGPAAHWSYDHSDPDELVEDGMPYSLDPAHYQPRCQPCHRRFDTAR